VFVVGSGVGVIERRRSSIKNAPKACARERPRHTPNACAFAQVANSSIAASMRNWMHTSTNTRVCDCVRAGQVYIWEVLGASGCAKVAKWADADPSRPQCALHHSQRNNYLDSSIKVPVKSPQKTSMREGSRAVWPPASISAPLIAGTGKKRFIMIHILYMRLGAQLRMSWPPKIGAIKIWGVIRETWGCAFYMCIR
jgi:hypothetical protein